MFKRRIWLIGAIALVIVAITATILVIVLRKNDDQTARPLEPTVWERIETSADQSGRMALEPARQAFAYLFGGLPGVALPPGRPDPPGLSVSASGPIRWVLAHWKELTEEQRAAVLRVVEAPAEPQRLTSTGPLDLAAGAQPERDAAKAVLTDEVRNLQAEIGKRLGITIPPVRLFLEDFEKGPKVRAWTLALAAGEEADPGGRSATIEADNPAPAQRCDMHVPPSMWRTQVSGPVSPAVRQTLGHELMHCHEGFGYPSVGQYRNAPGWIIEGGADFGGSDIAGVGADDAWRQYLTVVGPLTARHDSAMGWWFHVRHQGHDPWKALPTIWKADQDNTTAYRTAGGAGDDVYDTWAASFLRNQKFGAAWEVHGVGVPNYEPALLTGLADSMSFSAPAYDARVIQVDVPQPKDTIVRLKVKNPVRLHDSDAFEQVHTSSGDYCTGGECVCPKNSKKAGLHIQQVLAPLFVAVPGGEGGNSAASSTMSLKDYCEEEDEKNKCTSKFQAVAEQPGCGSEAGSNGEPHLTSFDGREFDFQAGGEFTLARSDSGDLEIQSRQEALRWYGQENLAISVNTAVAARVGPDRVGMYPTREGLRVRVNGGEPAEVTDEQRLPGGGSVVPRGSDAEIHWPDGTKLAVVRIAEFGLNLVVTPAISRLRTLHGMLGPYEGVDKNPTMQDRGGKRYDAPNSDTLYKVIGDSWRIKQADSLFDYAPGQSTETFTRREMPNRLITLKDLQAEQKAAGEAACAPITDTKLREQCIFDVALTGDNKFVDGYKSVQQIISRGGVQDGATVKGDIAKPEEVDSYQVDLAAGEEFRIADESDDLKFSLEEPNTTNEHVLPGTIAGLTVSSFRVTAAGSYQLRVSRDAPGPYSFRFVMVKPRKGDIKIGDQRTAHLDLPGRVEEYTFDSGDASEVRLVGERCGDVWFGIDEDNPELNPGSNPCFEGKPHTFTVDPGKRYVLAIWSNTAKTEDFTFRLERP